jgi:hypothetical protein
LHVVGSSGVLDIPGLVVQSGLDGQRSLVEVPYLGSLSVGVLDNHVCVVWHTQVSVFWKLGNNMEVSLDIKIFDHQVKKHQQIMGYPQQRKNQLDEGLQYQLRMVVTIHLQCW